MTTRICDICKASAATVERKDIEVRDNTEVARHRPLHLCVGCAEPDKMLIVFRDTLFWLSTHDIATHHRKAQTIAARALHHGESPT